MVLWLQGTHWVRVSLAPLCRCEEDRRTSLSSCLPTGPKASLVPSGHSGQSPWRGMRSPPAALSSAGLRADLLAQTPQGRGHPECLAPFPVTTRPGLLGTAEGAAGGIPAAILGALAWGLPTQPPRPGIPGHIGPRPPVWAHFSGSTPSSAASDKRANSSGLSFPTVWGRGVCVIVGRPQRHARGCTEMRL